MKNQNNDWENILFNLNNLHTKVVNGKVIIFVLVMLFLCLFGLYKGISNINNYSNEYAVNKTYYIADSNGCKLFFGQENGKWNYAKVADKNDDYFSPTNCASTDDASLQDMVTKFSDGARAVHRRGLYYTYIFAFLLFTGFMYMNTNNDLSPYISENLSPKTVIRNWLIFSIIIFPFSYRSDMGSSYDYNEKVTVHSIIISKDATKYIYAPPTFLAKGRQLGYNVPMPLNER